MLKPFLLTMLLLMPGFGGTWAATSAAESPASAPAAAASAALNVTETVAQIAASADLQRAALGRLERAESWRELAARTATLQADFDRLEVNRADQAELVELLGLEHRAWALKGSASTVTDELAAILRSLEHDRQALETEAARWQERVAFLRDRQVPETVLDRAHAVAASLQATSDRVRAVRDSALLDYVKAFTLHSGIVQDSARIAARLEQVRSQRTALETAPLWALGKEPSRLGLVVIELRKATYSLGEYLSEHGGRLALRFFGILAATWWLFTRRPARDLGPAQRAYGRPVAASMLIALVSLAWWAPRAPVVFYELLLLLTPLPAAMLARRSFAAAVPLSLYGLALATVLLALRNLVEASPLADRALLLMQTLCVGVPVAVDLQRGRLQRAFARWSPDTVRLAALAVIALSAATALNVLIGFTGPARSLRAGAGSVLGFGLVFGATALALYGVALALFASPLLRWLRSARQADAALLRALRLALGIAALGAVVVVTLGNLRLMSTAVSAIDALLSTSFEVGAFSLSAAAIAQAAGIALATLVLTAVTNFILDREVFPRLKLRPGAGYAIATFIRWLMIIIGVMLALAALGLDMSKVTLIAGALGVGIGFGLQNVVNNFVSGLILIVERPVSVGDLIEIGALTGEIKRIGIRSSSVRTSQGAEVVVPNSELISKEVINWTRSDRRRRYDIDIGVAQGSEPEQVMRLLLEAAREIPEIMSDPAPQAVFRGFGDKSLNFRLLAWVEAIDLGLQAQNALRVAMLRKLNGAGIVIAG